MAGSWFRVYTEIGRDRKLRRLPPAIRWLWIVMLALAKESPRPGYLLLAEGVPVTIDDLVDEAAISKEEVLDGVKIFADQMMLEVINDIWLIKNWDKRQFASDNSTDRWNRWKNKQPTNVEQTLNQRNTNVGPTPPDYRVQTTETDIKNNICVPGGPHECSAPAENPQVQECGGAQQREGAKTAPAPKKAALTVGKAAGKGEEYSKDFVDFWSVYPRRVEKKAAYKAWNARAKEGIPTGDLITAAKNYAVSCRENRTEAAFIKHAKTFLGPSKPYEDYLEGPLVNQSGGELVQEEPSSRRKELLKKLYLM